MKLKEMLNEAKPKFDVKYATRRKGKIQVAKFMTLNGAKKFLKGIEKTGAKGIISVNGKPLKLTKQTTMDFGEASPGRRSRGRARQADARMKSGAKRWMADVSDEVEKLNPKMAGRIDWDTAQHLMNTGKKPKEAAKRLVKLGESKISRQDMIDVSLFADDAIPTDKGKWKVSTRAAKRKFGEASSEAKKRYVQKHYRDSGGSFNKGSKK